MEQRPLHDGRRVFFLSRDNDGKFKSLVLSVSGADAKNCKVKWWKEFCDMVVKWDGKKFTFKPL